MSENNKAELSDKDLDQVAGGMRKPGAAAGNGKDINPPKSVAPDPTTPSTPPPTAG